MARHTHKLNSNQEISYRIYCLALSDCKYKYREFLPMLCKKSYIVRYTILASNVEQSLDSPIHCKYAPHPGWWCTTSFLRKIGP